MWNTVALAARFLIKYTPIEVDIATTATIAATMTGMYHYKDNQKQKEEIRVTFRKYLSHNVLIGYM